MMGENRFTVTLDKFEGPLDILLFIVEKNKFDIKNLPLSAIIDQYFHYIKQGQEPNIADESHYMMVTAKLIKIKARMLLKGENAKEIEEIKQEFTQLLETYKYIREVATFLESRKRMYWDFFPSWRAQVGYVEDLNYGIMDLVKAIERIILRSNIEPEEKYVPADPLDIKARILELIGIFKRKKSEFFSALLSSSPTVTEVLEIFLATLELFKRGAIRLVQRNPSDEILIIATPGIYKCKGLEEVSL